MTDVKSKRKDVKKAWLGIKMIINLGDCTHSEMKQLVSAEKDFYNDLIKASTDVAANEDVLRRRRVCENSDDMQEILRLFWFVVSQDRDTATNIVTKNGYVQFSLRIQR
jgi:hypothetical protein